MKDDFTAGQGKARAVLQKYGLSDLKDQEGNSRKLTAEDFKSNYLWPPFFCFDGLILGPFIRLNKDG